jgi:hypothetical protein
MEKFLEQVEKRKDEIDE